MFDILSRDCDIFTQLFVYNESNSLKRGWNVVKMVRTIYFLKTHTICWISRMWRYNNLSVSLSAGWAVREKYEDVKVPKSSQQADDAEQKQQEPKWGHMSWVKIMVMMFIELCGSFQSETERCSSETKKYNINCWQSADRH